MQNAYLLAKIGADTAENEQHFAEIGNYPTGRLTPRRSAVFDRGCKAVPAEVLQCLRCLDLNHRYLAKARIAAPLYPTCPALQKINQAMNKYRSPKVGQNSARQTTGCTSAFPTE